MTMTKSQSAKLIRLGRGRETFSHETLGDFDITAIRAALFAGTLKHTRASFTLDAKTLLPWLLSRREVDKTRAFELSQKDLSEPVITLLIREANGHETHCVVDGTHRLYRLCLARAPEFRSYLIDLKDAIKFRPPTKADGWHDMPWGDLEVTPTGFKKRK